MSTTRPILALLGAAGCFATFGVVIRTLDHGFGPLMQTAARAGVLLLCALPLIRRATPTRHTDQPRRATVAALGLAIAFPCMIVCFTLAVLALKAANALFLLYAVSLLGSLGLGRWWYGEPITATKGVAGGCALIGLACFAVPTPQLWSGYGVLLALAAGACEAVGNACRRVIDDRTMRTVLLGHGAIGVGLGLALSWASGEVMVRTLSPDVFVALAVYGLAGSGGNLLLSYGLRHYDLHLGTVIFSSELVMALALNAWWLREVPTWREAAGAACILLAIGLTQRRPRARGMHALRYAPAGGDPPDPDGPGIPPDRRPPSPQQLREPRV